MIILELLLLFIVIILIFILIYFFFLTIAGLRPFQLPDEKDIPKKRFIIIVPAHNEEKVIERTLNSLKMITYPRDLFSIVVVADNCIDGTAQIVRGSGVECLERKDAKRPGKGQALSWVFTILLKRNYFDAFVIIDADTMVDPNLLAIMNRYLAMKAKVIQAYYDVLYPARSPMASLTYLGFAISRNLKYRGKSRLGWSVNLVGNGMCFSRDVIERFGWKAFSISEDLEYQLQLLLNGIPVSFAPETKVYGEIPSDFKSFHKQKSRWDIGKYKLRNQYTPILFSRGLKEKKMAFFDAILELVIPPYIIYAGTSIFFYGIYFFAFYQNSGVQFYIWNTLVAGLIIYTLLGLIVARAPIKVYMNLIYVPFFLLWRIAIALISPFTEGKTWVKTERT